MSPEPTRRQREVFEAVCRTGSTKAAAHELGITAAGVRDNLTALYRRIGADGIGHAAWLLWGPGTEHPYKIMGQGVRQGS